MYTVHGSEQRHPHFVFGCHNEIENAIISHVYRISRNKYFFIQKDMKIHIYIYYHLNDCEWKKQARKNYILG